ncbi:MAG: hypothetical protein GY788_08555 [bacterium]|nr:hypothetical protein [bacterium]
MPPRTPAVSSIREGLEKLIREIAQLKNEVHAINKRLGAYRKKHPVPRDTASDYDPDFRAFGRGHRTETEDPRAKVPSALMDIEAEAPGPATRALMSMLDDLDGALRDVRAARRDIDLIAGDSDQRARFKKWNRGYRG